MSSLVIVAEHLGSLHPYEKALALTLAFGPFVPLTIVIARRERADRRAEAAERADDEVVDHDVAEP